MSQHHVLSPQKILNGEIHNWYRIVHGYSDHLVKKLLNRFDIQPGQKILDAFCGTGTTLVECMKLGIDSIGIDANPSSCFAAQVKTNWKIKGDNLLRLLNEVEDKFNRSLQQKAEYRRDTTYLYLESTGMIKRGWISSKPLRKAIILKNCISKLATTTPYKNAMTLALISEVTYGASNVKFGPELYCGPVKEDVDVFSGFAARLRVMAKDLQVVSTLMAGKAQVCQGDSRNCNELLSLQAPGPYDAVICSPPYPSEHDYTRNSRLELAFLEDVVDRKTLQSIKRNMIRSHSKNIYKGDNDSAHVKNNQQISAIVQEIRHKAERSNCGFAYLYPTVVEEYFGGMTRHLKSIKGLLTPKAQCAYVVGDQSSYFQVHIPTAEILSSLASEAGFKTLAIERWRSRWSSTTSKEIDENILILENT
jgi:hypothetical protein